MTRDNPSSRGDRPGSPQDRRVLLWAGMVFMVAVALWTFLPGMWSGVTRAVAVFVGATVGLWLAVQVIGELGVWWECVRPHPRPLAGNERHSLIRVSVPVTEPARDQP